MLYTSDIFVCVFLCSLQGRLDGFPTPIRSMYIPNILNDNNYCFQYHLLFLFMTYVQHGTFALSSIVRPTLCTKIYYKFELIYYQT